MWIHRSRSRRGYFSETERQRQTDKQTERQKDREISRQEEKDEIGKLVRKFLLRDCFVVVVVFFNLVT